MNDAALSKYYYGSAYQHAELSTPIHSWEHDTTNMGGSYVNSNCVGGSFLEDEQTFFHNNLLQAQPTQHELLGQDQLLAPEIFKESTACNETSVPSSNTLADIPFVQIHTTILEPPDKSYHNVFRRKAEPIKAEPIKSETTESGKERVNSTPTPPSRNSSYACIEGKANIAVDNSSHAETPQSIQPNVHKCTACPFISISQDCVSSHVATVHAAGAVENFRQRILCPGCENIFYSLNSFDLHLREDHLMVPDEASSILYDLQNEQNLAEALVEPNVSAQPGADAESKAKSRIFIKNVNCLRAHQEGVAGGGEGGSGVGGTAEQQTQIDLEALVGESNNNNDVFNLNDPIELSDSSSLHLKQTISIKSVDVLREPGLGQTVTATYANYSQTDSANINGSNNNNNNNNNNICVESNINKNYNDEPPSEGLELENIDRPRRPKIYIKNVDILKEPMLFPRNLNVTNIQNMNFNFATQDIVSGPFQNNPCVEMLTPTTNNGFENNLPTLADMHSEPYLFDNNTMVTSRSGGNTNINGEDFIDSYVNGAANTIITNHNFTLDNTRFVDDLDIGFNYTNTVTVVTEPTLPPPLPMPTVTATVSLSSTPDADPTQMTTDQSLPPELTIPKQKIFIKNVDILKAPQVHLGQQHQKGTLHLRTVDELNLMNRNEVENLMAPNHQFNPEQIDGTAATDLQATTDDLSVSQISDFVSDFPNSWTNEDYDLGDDLDCIITDTIDPLMNITKSFVTTQVLSQSHKVGTDPICPQEVCNNSLTSISEMDSITQIAEDLLNEDFVTLYSLPAEQMEQNSKKQEITFSSVTPTTTLMTNVAVETNVISIIEVPPLVPVTSTTSDNRTDTPTLSKPQNQANIVVPPLVPLNNVKDEKANNQSSITKGNTVAEENVKSELQSGSSDKTARIYVANNLHQDSGASSSTQDLAGGTSVRGRPYGAKRTGITKLRKQSGSAAESQVGVKCSINGCAFRFKVAETLEYHKRCHNGETNATQICPECKSANFTNWNSLHTHLWRSHQIDMELYRCPQCDFRTPIYSRLVNTHAKIHSEERNYKCDHCGKGFKNTKQLKNHRRWHRTTNNKPGTESAVGTKPKLFPCEDCGAAFSYIHSLREHLCKNRDEQIQCEVCQKALSSKSSLKLHMLTHNTEKRFKCDHCDYEASDHNAFRRHRMVHLDQSKYSCPHCDAKFIQSCTYQRHIHQKHPEQAADIVHKCTLCNYTTINRTLLIVHQAKHECASVASNMQQQQQVQKDAIMSSKNQQQQVIPTSSRSSAPSTNDINSRTKTTHTSREAASALPQQQQQQVLVPESAQIPHNLDECSGYIKTKNQSKKQFNTDAFQSGESIEQRQEQSVEQFSQISG